MDFIYSSDASCLRRIVDTLSVSNVLEDIEFRASGTWGAFASTRTPYRGLEPAFFEHTLHAILGDPLLGAPHDGGTNGRTIALARAWQTQPLVPQHPSALLRFREGYVDAVTDAWSAVSLYYKADGKILYVATSPDLIAEVADSKVDRVSAFELLAASQIAYPNTLYTDIYQVPPGCSARLTKHGLSYEFYWVPPKPGLSHSIEDWRSLLHEIIRSTFIRVRDELGPSGHATLSAGLDTRYLVSMATRDQILDLTTVTLSPHRNIEFWIARQAAHVLGLPHQHAIAKPDSIGRRLIMNSASIPSHTSHQGANFFDKALGRIESPFVLGGYMADTLLQFSNPFYSQRWNLIRKNLIPKSSPRWASTVFALGLASDVSHAIDER